MRHTKVLISLQANWWSKGTIGRPWFTSHNCIHWVAKCAVCQVFAQKEMQPASFYTSITTMIPFAKWGIDLLVPFAFATRRFCFCIVAVDYFTKWIEVELLLTIIELQCRRFLCKIVICHFGLPKNFISNNGRQFDFRPFIEFCQRYRIRHTKVFISYAKPMSKLEMSIGW